MLSKIYLCPADKKHACSWEGSSDDIYEHFIQEHEDLLYMANSIEIVLDDSSENLLLLIDTEIYLLQAKFTDEYLNIFLRYLGPAKIASNLTYDIDISSNGIKMGKQAIEMRDGCFSISLEYIQASFGNINKIDCRLLISGDFASNDDSVFLEDTKQSGINKTNEEVDNVEPEKKDEEVKDLTINLENLFLTPKEGNSPVEMRENKKFSLDETSRATCYDFDEKLPKEKPFLSRSQTFSAEDIKRISSSVKRHASMRSLSSIAETDLDSELKCSNCDCHLAPPIFLCASEHNICASCYRERKTCSLCDKEISADRNEDLEEKTFDFLYTCINKKHGCLKKLPHSEISDHEVNCSFCQYHCPIEECAHKGGYKDMFGHLSLIHSSVKMFQSFIAVFQKYEELFLVNENMGIFYCTWSQLDNMIVWKAKFCGPKARKFFCELKFKGKTFKRPLLLTKHDDYYFKEMTIVELKEQKLKVKNSILTITR